MSTIYVSPGGNDAWSGASAAPVATLAGAVAKLPAEGGTIRLGPGTYLHEAEVAIDRPVRILGAGMDQTFIRGAQPSSWQVYIHHATGVRVRDLTFDVNDPCGTGERGAVRMEHVRDVEVRRVRFVRPSAVGLEVGVFDGGQFSTAIVNEDIRLRDCEFVDISPGSTREQALFFNTREISVRRCRFEGIEGGAAGIGLFQAVADVTVKDCAFLGVASNRGVGLYYGVTTRALRVERCAFVCNNGIFGGNGSDNAAIGVIPDDTHAVGILVQECWFLCGGDGRGLLLAAVNGAWVDRCRFLCCDGVALQIGREDTNPESPRPYDCTGIVVESCTFAHNNRLGLDPLLHPDVFFTHIPAGHDLQARISRCVFRNENPQWSLSAEPMINGQREVTGLLLEENDSERESALVLRTPS